MSTRLMVQSRYQEAVTVLRGQAELGRSLAQGDPLPGVQSGFFSTLFSLCISLHELGRDGEARAAGEEALDIIWPLFERDRDEHGKNTGMVIRRLERIYANTRQSVPPRVQARLATFKRSMRP
jgi:hypothetical protein